MKYRIRIWNKEHSEQVQKALFEKGYEWGDGNQKVSVTQAELIWARSENGLISHSSKNFGDGSYTSIDLDGFDKIPVFKRPIIIKLNKSHDAEIQNEAIKVGCQFIYNPQFENLVLEYYKFHAKPRPSAKDDAPEWFCINEVRGAGNIKFLKGKIYKEETANSKDNRAFLYGEEGLTECTKGDWLESFIKVIK